MEIYAAYGIGKMAWPLMFSIKFISYVNAINKSSVNFVLIIEAN